MLGGKLLENKSYQKQFGSKTSNLKTKESDQLDLHAVLFHVKIAKHACPTQWTNMLGGKLLENK